MLMLSHNFVEQVMTYISLNYQKYPANNEKGTNGEIFQ